MLVLEIFRILACFGAEWIGLEANRITDFSSTNTMIIISSLWPPVIYVQDSPGSPFQAIPRDPKPLGCLWRSAVSLGDISTSSCGSICFISWAQKSNDCSVSARENEVWKDKLRFPHPCPGPKIDTYIHTPRRSTYRLYSYSRTACEQAW